MKNSIALAKIALLISVVIWGLSIVSMKFLVDYFPPMTVNFLRFTVASIILIPIVMVIEPRWLINKKDLLLIFITGALGISFYYYFESLGLIYLDASNVGLIAGTIPIMTYFTDSIMNRKKINFTMLIIFSISTIGVFLTIMDSFVVDFGMKDLIGYLFVLLGCFSWVLYTIFTKNLEEKYSPLCLLTYQTIAGSICLSPALLIEEFNIVLWIREGNNFQWVLINLMFLGLIASALAYYLYMYGFTKIGVSESSLYMNLMPVVTMLSGGLILKESIGFYKILGAIFIIASVILCDNDILAKFESKIICILTQKERIHQK